ncbi:MAG: hypothetical protein U0704_17850 [Candidatus Eisenbacteria bacterium]
MRTAIPAETLRVLPAPLVALLAFLPFFAWIQAARTLLPGALAGTPHGTVGFSPEMLVGFSLAVAAAMVACEALFWRAFWVVRGAQPSFTALALVLWLLTMPESFGAVALARTAGDPHARVWLAPWLGYRALHAPDAGTSGWVLAFGGTGLLTAARVALSGGVQARLAGRRVREAVTWVALVWFASHVAQAWTFELVRGRALGPR